MTKIKKSPGTAGTVTYAIEVLGVTSSQDRKIGLNKETFKITVSLDHITGQIKSASRLKIPGFPDIQVVYAMGLAGRYLQLEVRLLSARPSAFIPESMLHEGTYLRFETEGIIPPHKLKPRIRRGIEIHTNAAGMEMIERARMREELMKDMRTWTASDGSKITMVHNPALDGPLPKDDFMVGFD